MKKSFRLFLAIANLLVMALFATPPQTTVNTPNGGENLLFGTEYIITWNCSNCVGDINVIVEIFNVLHSGPGYQGQISPAGVTMSQGHFKWQVVGKLNDGTFLKPGPGYKIHLEAIDGSDASDNTFSIVKLAFPKIVVSQLNLTRLPDCPECVRIDLKPLLETFQNSREVFRITLFANGEKAADLGNFGGRSRTSGFIDTRLERPLQTRNRRGHFELRLFNTQGQLLQNQVVQLLLK